MPGRWVRWNEGGFWEASSNDGGAFYPLVENHEREFASKRWMDLHAYRDERPDQHGLIVCPEDYDFKGLAGVIPSGRRSQYISPDEIFPPQPAYFLPGKKVSDPPLSAVGTSRVYHDRVQARPLISVSGGPYQNLASPIMGCVITRSADKAIATATWTNIDFDLDSGFDFGGLHDPVTNNTRVTLPVAGIWMAIFHVAIQANNTGSRFGRIVQNGTDLCYNTHAGHNTVGSGMLFQVVDIRFRDVGYYLEAGVWQDSGGNLNALAAFTSFQVWLLQAVPLPASS